MFDESKNESGPVVLVVSVNEAAPDPRRDPRLEPRLEPRIDPRIFERVERQPNLGDVLRTRVPRRPGG